MVLALNLSQRKKELRQAWQVYKTGQA